METKTQEGEPDQLEKHQKYMPSYKPNDTFWGLGIEREAYLESPETLSVTGEFFKNQVRERYSVDYYKSYKPTVFNAILLDEIIDPTITYKLPVLINAHSLTKTDMSNNHRTLQTAKPPPNPAFAGKTIHDLLTTTSNFLSTEYEQSYTYDGDTIELITQNFYKATVTTATKEMLFLRDAYIRALNTSLKSLPAHPYARHPIKWMQKNHGIAVMATNPKNISIFNNGTYHINITLPTKTDSAGNIANFTHFTAVHRNAINYYQWLEPFLIAVYGTGDILSITNNPLVAKGSLRCALSRYIGVGTYDTTKMPRGKLLVKTRTDSPVAQEPHGWMWRLAQESGYVSLPEIGYDINFNKHHNHGIEFRIFDWFPEERLEELLTILVHVADAAQEITPCSPIRNSIWNDLTYNAIKYGKEAQLTPSHIMELTKQLKLENMPLRIKSNASINILYFWNVLAKHIVSSYWGPATHTMMADQAPSVSFKKCF
jgi:hypothetical protein